MPSGDNLTLIVSVSVVAEGVLVASDDPASGSLSLSKNDLGTSSSFWIIVGDDLLLDAANTVRAFGSKEGMYGREPDGDRLWGLRSCGGCASFCSRADESDDDDNRLRFCCKFLNERDLDNGLESFPAFSRKLRRVIEGFSAADLVLAHTCF